MGHDLESETAQVVCLSDVLTRAGAVVTLASVEKTLELRLNHGITAAWLHDGPKLVGAWFEVVAPTWGYLVTSCIC